MGLLTVLYLEQYPDIGMETHLPYKSVVVFIACGAMLCAIVFVFAKRQITRFALKSNRVPHAAIGANAPKVLQQELEARLRRVEEIKFEAQLLSENITSRSDCSKYQFYFRMKAVDAVKEFEAELKSKYPEVSRHPGTSVHTFLLDQSQNASGSLYGIKTDIIEKFVQLYEHARHEPAPFQQEHYQEYMDLLNHLLNHLRDKYENEKMDRELEEESTNKHQQEVKHSLLHSLIHKPHSQVESVPSDMTHHSQIGAGGFGSYSNITSEKSEAKDTCVVYRPSKMKESDSGMFLLTSRQSSSSEGSTAEAGTQHRQSGVKDGEESFV